MKIEQIEKFQLYPRSIKEAWIEDEFVWPSRLPSFLVRVTSESGDYGVGEASSQQWYLGETNDQIAQCLEIYSDILRGEDPRNFANCHRIMEAAYGGGMPSGRTARSGIDMALYDLVGKNFSVPVHALLGGAYRTRFELLTNLYHKSPEEMATACSHFVDRGFTGLKIKVGDVLLSKGWSRTHLLAELDKLSAALDVTPRHVYVDADANQGWVSAAWTVSALKRFNQSDNLSIEQPLPFDNLDGAVHVRKRSGVPVILDESIWSATRMAQIARMQACDRIVLKLNRLGGFFEAAKVISICESMGIGVSVDTNPYTLVGDTAVCHIAAICRHHYPVDCEGHQSFLSLGKEEFVTGGVSIKGNHAVLPEAPGLGVDIDWEALIRHQKLGYGG
jgi:L-alanine-DL-glutamate epimerase-like enolase superfamily enzyme